MSTAQEQIIEEVNKGLFIPMWAIWVFVVIIIPWSTWMTVSMADVSYKSSVISVHAVKIADLENKYGEILTSVKVIEATKFTSNDGKQLTRTIEDRLDRLEVKFDAMRREIDKGGFKSNEN